MSDAVHVVTGASAGIGRGVVEALVDRGQTVVAVARRAAMLAELRESHGEAVVTVACDVATGAGRSAIVTAVGAAPVVGLVHAAATPVPVTPWREIDPDRLGEQFRVHVAAPIALTASLLERGPVARVVVIDSYSARTPRIGWSAYSLLKAAAQMSFRAAAEELEGTVVVRAFPGAVDTDVLRAILDADPSVQAAHAYRALADAGQVSDPASIGREIARLLLDVEANTLSSRDEWHIGHSIPDGSG